MTDTEIKVKGMEALGDALGLVEAERFVNLLMREPFDYTEWQRTLFEGHTVESLSALAMAAREARGCPESPRKKLRDRFVIYRDQEGHYRWDMVSPEGSVLQRSPQGFESQSDCLAAVNAL